MKIRLFPIDQVLTYMVIFVNRTIHLQDKFLSDLYFIIYFISLDININTKNLSKRPAYYWNKKEYIKYKNVV